MLETKGIAAALCVGLLLAAAPPIRAQEDETNEVDAPSSSTLQGAEPFQAAEDVESTQRQNEVTAGAPDADGASISGRGLGGSQAPARPSGGSGSGGSSRGGGGGGVLPTKAGPKFACFPGPAEKTTGAPRVSDVILAGMAPSRSSVARSVLRVGRYLYVSGEPGMQTIDVSDPENLVMTSDWAPSSAKMNGAATKGGVLYITNWHPGDGLVLFDLSNPAKPAYLKTIATPNFSWEANVTGDLLDVAVGNETKSAIVTYDVSDPRNPKHISSINIDRRLIGNATRHRGYLYFTQDNFLYVYDASDPTKPRRVREFSFKSLCGQTQVRGNFLYMLERKVVEGQEGGLRVFSLADPANPQPVGFWAEAEPKDLYFIGNRAVIPTGGTGVHVLDVSNPVHPRASGFVGIGWPGMGQGGYPVTVDGAGNYAFVGATSGNNPTCADASCACYGGRVYSVRIAE